MRVAVSACLLGEPCRYDGASKPCAAVRDLALEPGVELVPVCPEVMGGLPTPRAASELVWEGLGGQARAAETGASGWDAGDAGIAAGDKSSYRAVSEGLARVVSRDGHDNSMAFLAGARAALEACREQGCTVAVLKAKSPSCGSGLVYDGTFSGTLVDGWGVAASLLRENGIDVVDENGAGKLVR